MSFTGNLLERWRAARDAARFDWRNYGSPEQYAVALLDSGTADDDVRELLRDARREAESEIQEAHAERQRQEREAEQEERRREALWVSAAQLARESGWPSGDAL